MWRYKSAKINVHVDVDQTKRSPLKPSNRVTKVFESGLTFSYF